MANFTINNVRIQLKHDTAANWATSTITLMAGEMAIETDTKKFKIGDGTKTFAQLPYADADGITASRGSADANKVIKTDENGLLDDSFLKAITANQDTDNTDTATSVLTSASIDNRGRTTATTKMGIAAASTGTSDAAKLVQANASGKLDDTFLNDAFTGTPGTFTKVTVDAKGRVTAATDIATADITDRVATTDGTSTNAGKAIITDATGELADSFLKAVTRTNTASANNGATSVIASITSDTKGRVTATTTLDATVEGGVAAASGKLVKLNAAGKLADSIIPPLAIGEVYGPVDTLADVATTAAGVPVQTGDMAIVQAVKGASETDEAFATRQLDDGLYIYKGDNGTYSTSNFAAVKTPGESVQSVNGKTGRVVVIGTDDINEGSTHLYYTDARVDTYVKGHIASTDLTDGSTVLHNTDTYTLNGGDSTDPDA